VGEAGGPGQHRAGKGLPQTSFFPGKMSIVCPWNDGKHS
jgi:hypothetical protein